MEKKINQIDAELLAEIEKFEVAKKKKKKKKGWRPSKLDRVSDVLLEMRCQGKSLQFMAEFVLEKFGISAHKSTVKRQLDKLNSMRQEKKNEE